MNIQISKEFADDLIKQLNQSNVGDSAKTLITFCIEQSVRACANNQIMALLTTKEEMQRIQDKIVSDIKDKIKYPTIVGWQDDYEAGIPYPVIFSCGVSPFSGRDFALRRSREDYLDSLTDGSFTKWYPYSWMFNAFVEESADYYIENSSGWIIDPVIIYPKE